MLLVQAALCKQELRLKTKETGFLAVSVAVTKYSQKTRFLSKQELRIKTKETGFLTTRA